MTITDSDVAHFRLALEAKGMVVGDDFCRKHLERQERGGADLDHFDRLFANNAGRYWWAANPALQPRPEPAASDASTQPPSPAVAPGSPS